MGWRDNSLEIGGQVEPLPVTGITLNASRALLYLFWGLALATGLLIFILTVLDPNEGGGRPYVLAVGLVPLLLLLASIPIKRITQCRLRVFSDRLVLENFDGTKLKESFETLRWSKSAFIIDDRSIIWNNGKNQGLFPIEEFRLYVLPRFRQINQLSEWEMFRFQMGHMPRWLKWTLLILLAGPPVLAGFVAIAFILIGN